MSEMAIDKLVYNKSRKIVLGRLDRLISIMGEAGLDFSYEENIYNTLSKNTYNVVAAKSEKEQRIASMMLENWLKDKNLQAKYRMEAYTNSKRRVAGLLKGLGNDMDEETLKDFATFVVLLEFDTDENIYYLAELHDSIRDKVKYSGKENRSTLLEKFNKLDENDIQAIRSYRYARKRISELAKG